MKKSLAALALAGSIVLLNGVPAMADTHTYPAPASDIGVSRGTLAPGQIFTLTLRGYQPFERVTIAVTLRTTRPQSIGGSFSGGASMAVPSKITLPLAVEDFTVTADAEGTISIPLSLDEAGDYTITATGASGRTLTTSVTADPDAADTTNNDGDNTADDNGNSDGDNTGTSTNNDGDNTGTSTADSGPALSNNGTGTGTSTADSGPALANTGADTSLALWSLVGAGALAAGVTSVVVVRRRAKADASA